MNTKPITTSYYPTIKVNKQQQQPIHIYIRLGTTLKLIITLNCAYVENNKH